MTDRTLSEKDKSMWRDVKLLILDKISFMGDDHLKKLDRRLKEMGDKTIPFGHFSVIFAGDFRQLERCGSSESQILFSGTSSNLWNDSVKTIIVLNNDHRFREYPDYGKMMKWMLDNNLSQKDRKRINTGTVKRGVLELPKQFNGDAC